MKKTLQIALLSLTATLAAEDPCCNASPAPCYPDDPICAYCVGPDMVNPPVGPRSCDGSWLVTLAGLYWNSHQDGMEFAIDNSVFIPANIPSVESLLQLNNLIDAEYQNPKFKWDFGFKAGFTFNSTHDGWDIGAVWTWYRGSASNHVEAEVDDNHTLIPLWSAYSFIGNVNLIWARDIEAHWSFKLNLADVELGREFWASKYLTLRPHIGIRFASLNQSYTLRHKGGVWSFVNAANLLNNEVNLRNDFCGVGARSGLNTIWNIGKGLSLFGNTAVSVIYGRFKVKHDEWNMLLRVPHNTTRLLETEDHFRASRAITDLTLGLQWSTPFGQSCQYGFALALAWEHHMFFDQNQMWRVNGITNFPFQSAYYQRRGDLDTQGLTVTIQFDF